MDHQSWFLTGADETRPTRLFCLPYAGGSAAAYARWRGAVDPDVALFPVQLPGRGSRIREAPVKDLNALAEGLARALEPRLDRPFALFGHSMGALLAFETARTLRRMGAPMPAALFVSARRGPYRPRTAPPLHRLSDPELLSRLAAMGGTPATVLDDAELLALMLPVIRADLEAVETHTAEPEDPLPCPVTAFGGLSDRVSQEELGAWSEATSDRFKLTMFEGGHFFLNTHSDAMLEQMTAALRAATQAPQSSY